MLKKWIAAILLAFVIVGGAFFVFYLFENNEQDLLDESEVKELVTTYVESFNTKDFDAFCGCFTPHDQAELRLAAEKMGGQDMFFERNYNSTFGNSSDANPFGNSVTLSLSDLTITEESIVDGMFNGHNMNELGASAVSTAKGKLTTKGSSGYQVDESIIFVCVKIDGAWYVYTMSATSISTGTNA